MVIVLVSSLSSLNSTPAWSRDIVLCYWATHFTLTVSLFTQEYKQVEVNAGVIHAVD